MEDRDIAWRVVEKHPFMVAKTWTDCVGQFGESDPSIIADRTFVFALDVDYTTARAMYDLGFIIGRQSSGWYKLAGVESGVSVSIDEIGIKFTPEQMATIQDAHNKRIDNTTKLAVVQFKSGDIAMTLVDKPL